MQEVIAGLSALPVPLVAFMVALNLSDTETAVTHVSVRQTFLIVVASWTCAYLVYRALIRIRTVGTFAVYGTIVIVVMQVATVALAILVNRDYFTAFFSNIASWCVLFLYWIAGFPRNAIQPEIRRGIGTTFLVAFILFTIWIFLMGYAIATRQEPRPIESLTYNAYNSLAAFGILLLSRTLIIRSYRTLLISPEAIYIDNRAIDGISGTVGAKILRTLYSAPGRKCTCKELFTLTRGKRQRTAIDTCPCDTCVPEQAKATHCAAYRSVYNRVLDLKKLIEFIEVGTILSPTNKRDIVTHGWKLALFEGVRVRTVSDHKPVSQTLDN